MSSVSPGGDLGRVEVPGLLRSLRVLRERWWIVLAVAAACVAGALAISLTSPKQYQAAAKLLFRNPGLNEAVGAQSPSTPTDPQTEQSTNVLLVTTGEVAAAVRGALHLDIGSDRLLGKIKVATEQNANVVDVTATDSDPRMAARIANAWVREYVLIRQQADRNKVAQGELLLRKRLASLAPADAADRADLSAALQKLTVLEAVQTGNAEVVDKAAVPASASSPQPKRDALVALLLGGALGVGLAFLLNVLDRRLKTVEDFEAAYGFRSLAAVPLHARTPSSQQERAAALEPYRILRNGLGFLSLTNEIRVVMVTSAMPGEGKTTVAGGLARAIALSGQSVVLVETDLRRPTFREQFDLGSDQRGLTTALVGGVPLPDLLRTVLPGLRNLMVLPSGPVPPNSAELLRSAEMGTVLEELKSEAELVVLDCPPLLPVADAQVLLDHPEVDACLVVARAYSATREQVRRGRTVLDRHRLTNMGLVINGLRQSEASYGYFQAEEAPGGLRLRT
jgi:capsular exopolysaccharide synthesis family protein